MTTDYWVECISIVAEENDIKLTKEQIVILAEAAENGHEHYGQAFYQPPAGDYFDRIEDGYKKKLKDLQEELDAYKNGAEIAVRKAYKINETFRLTVAKDGTVEVF